MSFKTAKSLKQEKLFSPIKYTKQDEKYSKISHGVFFSGEQKKSLKLS